MYPELTNLLPRSYVRKLRQSYFLRLLTVGVIMAVLLLIVHALLLVPSYLYASTRLASENRQLETIANSTQTAQEKEAKSRIAALSTDATYLSRLSTLPTGSGAVRALLAVASPGVRITGFSYTAPAKAGADASMLVSGVASTRDALRSYTAALGDLPYVKNVDLPISAYAKDSDIDFTLTVTGTLKP
jgi:hypothetical protein